MPSPVQDDARARLALTLAALLWSGNFVVGRALAGEIEPLTLNLLRWTLCLACLLPGSAARLWRHRTVVRREWRLLAALGATGIAGFHTIAYQALAHTSAVNALLIVALAPAAILAGGACLGARLSRTAIAGTAVSVLGAAVVITRGDGVAGLLAIDAGEAWMLAGVLVWTAYALLLGRRPADLPPDVALAASIALALPMMLVAWLLTGPRGLPDWPPLPPLPPLAAVLYMGVLASWVGYRCWAAGVAALGPERAGQFVNLMPVFGTVLAVGLLGETLVAAQVIGAALVLGGIVAAQHVPLRDRARAPAAP